MGQSFTFYQDLKMASAEEVRTEWTDVTTATLVTPNLPGTILSGTCDVATASPNAIDIKDSDGVSLSPLSNKGVRGGYSITVDNSGTLVTKTVVSVDGDTNTLVADADWGFTAADANFWITPIGSFRYVILGFEMFNEIQAKYVFEDGAGTPATVYGPMWLSADGGVAMEIARKATAGERLYVKQDGGSASKGSLHIWFFSEKV